MKDEEDYDVVPVHLNKTEDALDRVNEKEDFQEPISSHRQTLTHEDNINKLRKSLRVLQSIPKQSYESSLFFEMLQNPIEDFESQNSNEQEKEKAEDEVVIDKIQKGKSSEKICRICLGGDGDESDATEDNPLFAPCV